MKNTIEILYNLENIYVLEDTVEGLVKTWKEQEKLTMVLIYLNIRMSIYIAFAFVCM